MLAEAGLLFSGVVVGIVSTFLALTYWFRNPDHAKDLLRGAAEAAHKDVGHPHWLNEAENDPRVICPCCGWSEKRGVLAPGTRMTFKVHDKDNDHG